MDKKEICEVKNCKENICTKSLCSRHYQRSKIYGDPSYEYKYKWVEPIYIPRNMKHSLLCNIDGCDRKYKAKGMCNKHYSNNLRQKNREKYNKWERNWAKNNPEKKLYSNLKYLQKISESFDMTSSEYQYTLMFWSKSIKKLDNSKCKNCSSKNNLHAHHIMPKALFPKLSLDLDNGITLCMKCHSKIHSWMEVR